MAINSNILLQGIVPDTTKAAASGFKLGQDIRNAPLLRQQKEQVIAQNEQALAQGDIEAGQAESLAVSQVAGDAPITAENYEQIVRLLKRGGLPLEEDDFIASEQNISDLEQLRQRGMRNLSSNKNQSAIRGLEGDFNFRDENGNIFTQTTFIDPNTQETATRLTDATGRGIEPGKDLVAIDKLGQTVGEKTTTQVRSKNQEQRAQDTINAGIAAAPQYNDVTRGLELIDQVSQGGIAANAKAVTDYFGTTSGDVGELNRTLATTVLQGLSAFTGAISEGERKFVESMSASLKGGKEVNRRQLQRLEGIYKNQIKKAASLAKRNDDFITLDSLRVDLGDSELGRELFPKSFKKTSKPPQDSAPQNNSTTVGRFTVRAK